MLLAEVSSEIHVNVGTYSYMWYTSECLSF